MSLIESLLWLVFSWAVLSPAVTAVRQDCERYIVMEGTSYTYFRCYWDNPSSNVTWSLVSTTTGHVTRIGSCHSGDRAPGTRTNCDSPPFPNMVLKREIPTYSYVKINDVTREFAGIYVCSEHRIDGTVHTANCTMDVVSILVSSGDCTERTEGLDFSIGCSLSRATSGPITWSIVSPSGETTHIGTCDDVNNCTSPLSPYIEARQDSYSRSSILVSGLKRETAGTVICSNGTVASNCSLDVIASASVRNCSVRVDRADWSAVGSCDVQRTYSALEKYEYYIYQGWKPLPDQKVSTRVFSGTRPYSPTPFNDTEGRLYYRGFYAHSWPLPVVDGTYTHTIYTEPGRIGKSTDVGFVIERPSSPSVQCEGALRDAGRVPCVCSTYSLGRPAGRLIWFSGDTVLAAGQYGVISLQFPTNVTVDGNDKGLEITCQLDWVIKQNISVFLSADCMLSENVSSSASFDLQEKTLAALIAGTLLMLLSHPLRV